MALNKPGNVEVLRMHKMLMVWMAALLLLLPATMARSGEHRLGGGVNYWVALEDLEIHLVTS